MKARQAKKLLRGLSVLHLERGDVLVLSIPDHMPIAALQSISQRLSAYFPSHKVMVLDRGATLAAVRAKGTEGG